MNQRKTEDVQLAVVSGMIGALILFLTAMGLFAYAERKDDAEMRQRSAVSHQPAPVKPVPVKTAPVKPLGPPAPENRLPCGDLKADPCIGDPDSADINTEI